MNRKVKIILVIIGLFVFGAFFFIVAGLYAMEIEDQYGDHQNIYYKVSQGDIAVNRDTKEIRRIEKTWKRIFGINETDTIEMWRWLNENTIEIYRPASTIESDMLIYDHIDNLVVARKLDFVIKNR